MPWLVISKDGEELDRREITEPVVIGRSLDCDICIGEITLSRKHCRIEQKDGQWTVTDLKSRNGTFVNGEQVSEQTLVAGDVIRVADIEITFHTVKPAEGPSPARPRDPAEAMRHAAVQPVKVGGPGAPERKVILPKPRPRGPRSESSGSELELGSTMLRGVRVPLEPPEPPPLVPPPIRPSRPPEQRDWLMPVLVVATVVLAGVVVVLLVMLFRT